MKKYIWFIIAALAIIALAVFAYLPGAYFNSRSGTFYLWGRFKAKSLKLVEIQGKSQAYKLGNYWFDVSALQGGVLEYSIRKEKDGEVIYEGQCNYDLVKYPMPEILPGTESQPRNSNLKPLRSVVS